MSGTSHRTSVDFTERVVALCQQIENETGHRPTLLLQMTLQDGGVQAVRRLLNKPLPSETFSYLWELRRLDLVVEALAVQSEWRGLFTNEELRVAERRLEEFQSRSPQRA